MDRVGIDVAVQSCILGWDTTLENCQLINDCTAQMQKDFPGRFVGLAHAPVLEEAGLRELKRAISRSRIKGRNHLVASQRSIARRQRVHAVLRIDPKVRRAHLRSPGAGAEGLQLDERLPVAGDSHARVRSGCGGDAAYRGRRHRTLSRSASSSSPTSAADWPATKNGSRARRIDSSCLSRSKNISTGSTSIWPGSKAVRSHCAARWKVFVRSAWFLPPTIRRISITTIQVRGKNVDGVSEYIEEIRRLPLAGAVKEAMLGQTAAGLLKIEVKV